MDSVGGANLVELGNYKKKKNLFLRDTKKIIIDIIY